VELVPTTTESYRIRHLSHPDELVSTPLGSPGRYGQSLCKVNNLYGVIDQDRADYWTRGFRKQPVIAALPLCKRCAKAAPASREGGNQ
jgi:hypothetical protein